MSLRSLNKLMFAIYSKKKISRKMLLIIMVIYPKVLLSVFSKLKDFKRIDILFEST